MCYFRFKLIYERKLKPETLAWWQHSHALVSLNGCSCLSIVICSRSFVSFIVRSLFRLWSAYTPATPSGPPFLPLFVSFVFFRTLSFVSSTTLSAVHQGFIYLAVLWFPYAFFLGGIIFIFSIFLLLVIGRFGWAAQNTRSSKGSVKVNKGNYWWWNPTAGIYIQKTCLNNTLNVSRFELSVHSLLFFPKIVGIDGLPLRMVILFSNVLRDYDLTQSWSLFIIIAKTLVRRCLHSSQWW